LDRTENGIYFGCYWIVIVVVDHQQHEQAAVFSRGS
jgi:hypothetical protein